jgi:hypothetical protein
VLLLGMGRTLLTGGASPVLFGCFVMLAIRLWPLQSNTSFFIAWSAVPMFLLIGWGLSYVRPNAPGA